MILRSSQTQPAQPVTLGGMTVRHGAGSPPVVVGPGRWTGLMPLNNVWVRRGSAPLPAVFVALTLNPYATTTASGAPAPAVASEADIVTQGYGSSFIVTQGYGGASALEVIAVALDPWATRAASNAGKTGVTDIGLNPWGTIEAP